MFWDYNSFSEDIYLLSLFFVLDLILLSFNRKMRCQMFVLHVLQCSCFHILSLRLNNYFKYVWLLFPIRWNIWQPNVNALNNRKLVSNLVMSTCTSYPNYIKLNSVTIVLKISGLKMFARLRNKILKSLQSSICLEKNV